MFCGYDNPVCYFLRKHMTVLWLVYSCPGQEQLSVCWLLSVLAGDTWWLVGTAVLAPPHTGHQHTWPHQAQPSMMASFQPVSTLTGSHMCERGFRGWPLLAASSHLSPWSYCPGLWPGVHGWYHDQVLPIAMLSCWSLYPAQGQDQHKCVLATAVTMCRCLLLSIITRIIEPRCHSHENAIKSNNHFQLLHWHHNNANNCCRHSSSSAS